MNWWTFQYFLFFRDNNLNLRVHPLVNCPHMVTLETSTVTFLDLCANGAKFRDGMSVHYSCTVQFWGTCTTELLTFAGNFTPNIHFYNLVSSNFTDYMLH